jgi:hypothetical protein
MEWQFDLRRVGHRAKGSPTPNAKVHSSHLLVCWNGVIFNVFKVGEVWRGYTSPPEHYILMFDGDTDNVGNNFFATVYSWQNIKAKGVLTYHHRDWEQSTKLYDDEEDALVLETDVMVSLDRTCKHFSRARKYTEGLEYLGSMGCY